MIGTPRPEIAADPLALLIWQASSRTLDELGRDTGTSWLTTPTELLIANYLRQHGVHEPQDASK